MMFGQWFSLKVHGLQIGAPRGTHTDLGLFINFSTNSNNPGPEKYIHCNTKTPVVH